MRRAVMLGVGLTTLLASCSLMEAADRDGSRPVEVTRTGPVQSTPRTAPTTPEGGSTKPPCQRNVITINAEDETPCDLTPPQRLNIRFPIESDGVSLERLEEECNDLGGEPLWEMDALFCRNVDY